MGQNFNDYTPQLLTLAANTTASFRPAAISRTPFVSFHLTKLSTNNEVIRLQLFTSNVEMQGQVADGGVGYIRWPSGSQNEYLWAADTAFEQATSGSLTSAPFVTGSSSGSVTYDVTGLNARWARITVSSRSPVTLQLVTHGKD